MIRKGIVMITIIVTIERAVAVIDMILAMRNLSETEIIKIAFK